MKLLLYVISSAYKSFCATFWAFRNNAVTEWLKFDIALLENFALDSFLSIADKTRLER
jgi:hypothetical protein